MVFNNFDSFYIKNIKIITFFLILISSLYSIVHYFIKNNEGLSIDFIQETLPFIIIVSIIINFSQKLIGKKLLPTLYKHNADESAKSKRVEY